MSECNCKFSLYFFVGMMNCRPGKPFPAEDKVGEFLDKSKNGVVFMSFGSIIKASSMPKENKDIILQVFARFPQYNFIWKWEEELPNKPKNVLGMNYYLQHQLLHNQLLKFTLISEIYSF